MANYLSDDVDANGDPTEPVTKVLDVNLKGMINTATLGFRYMKNQKEGGAVIMTASGAGRPTLVLRILVVMG